MGKHVPVKDRVEKLFLMSNPCTGTAQGAQRWFRETLEATGLKVSPATVSKWFSTDDIPLAHLAKVELTIAALKIALADELARQAEEVRAI